jgi:2-methylcitrate dehydratase PrpD
LAAAGFTGAPALTLGTDHWSDLGDTWLICQQYFKPYPVCRWAQAPITAVLDLKNRHGFDSQAITGLHILSFHESVRLGTKQVTTTEEAQYSTSFPCALALVHGTILPEHVADAALEHPEVQRLSSILTMEEDASANCAFPNRRLARAEITLATGQCLQSDWFEPDWDPTTPPSAEDLERKFFNYASPALGLARSQAIQRAVEALDHTATAQPLLDLLAQPIS